MKKNLLYFFIALALAALVYFLATNKKEGSYKESDKDFSLADTNSIGKIFLADMSGESITLTRTQNGWMLDEKTHARTESISTLLRTIAQIRADIPVAKSMMEMVVKTMATENTKIELYNLQGEKIKTYYLGKPNTNYKGNFALMEGSEVPFVINIPGYDGIISTRYTTNMQEWKSRKVFDITPDALAEVSVNYPNRQDSSFTLVKTEEGFVLQNAQGFNPELTKYFASQFKNLNCENFLMDTYKLDSLRTAQPVCIISAKDVSGTSSSIKIFYRPVTYRTKTQFTYEGDTINFDLDKFYGLMNNDSELAIIQNFVFGKLFVGPGYFYQQRPANKNVLTDAIMENTRKGK